ncbi:glutamyl-tRNA reductase [Alteromonas sp. KS69]|jgi:glutamyl-tRNA reductase|uniref:glutamyl-tRNA reductase n=1 Tax=unclassified Alteromonas TaxID=2614992 RepID=UPI000C0D7C36|nr:MULTISPECIES: glutamyl-tRNA reductase [unclassified Alteromonas]MBO7924408.1 glutamyl-tRNA reductase [Alteromonas sp. K632G]PHS50412.1 MAG: glutamyl-tRNA reductase [Alteromonas sp.]RUP75352.1 glutamyl-tRNA reductase [Alteromonas sp. KS69]|tara:strand:- start:5249 stop:6523 length:1275 start_codon:yes stop_codon:yes gene_type:complete
MTLLALGINHKTAPVALREKVAFTPDSLVEALASLRKVDGVDESVIVSTCNRTELYVNTQHESATALLAWLSNFHHVEVDEIANNSYVLAADDAVKHIMRVASGLDSLILGEPQILGQVKQAFGDAKHSGMINTEFDKLFQHTFSVAKRVRSETEIGANAVSVAYAAVQLAKHIFAELPKRSVLLVGAGETIELVAQHLKEQGVTCLAVANRTISRAEALAETLDASVYTLSQVPEHLKDFDIVISSTASQLPLIGKGMVEKALKQRRNMPMFLVDLAVPRDIEAQVNELGDAYLYTVDDLQHIVQKNLQNREQAALEAEKLIEKQAGDYMSWKQSQQSIDLVRQYRQKGMEQRDDVVEKALAQLTEGKDAETVLSEMAYKLTNTLLHPTTLALREAAMHDDPALSRWLGQALSLSDTTSDIKK